MARVYYEQDGITIYHGEALAVLRQLPDRSVDLIATDPPYFRVKGEWWDRQWDSAAGFLGWVGELCAEWRRVLRANGSIYVFASPEMGARVEVAMREAFNVLNRIRWVKDDGWHRKAEKEALRAYLSPWEEIIFAEQYGDQYEDAARALHKDVYSPLGRYIQTERERAGLTRNDVEVALGFVSSKDSKRGTALCYRWEEGSSLPTKEVYERLRHVLNARGNNGTEYLRREYEYLRREYDDLRRPFAVNARGAHTDIWEFATVAPTPGKHPCEKPLALMEHIIGASSVEGAMVLDCFIGSGTTLRAAKNLGRRAIGVDVDEAWCNAAKWRLAQAVLPLAVPS